MASGLEIEPRIVALKKKQNPLFEFRIFTSFLLAVFGHWKSS